MSYKTDFDALLSELEAKTPDPSRLVTDDPTPNTQRLFEFLKDCYGKKHISGQQYLFESELEDLVYYKYTGKIPAIRGYDFMGISGLGGGYDQIERALDWARNTGGILTMCWHWYAPDDMNDSSKPAAFYYKTTDYDRKTSFDLVRAMTDGTPENDFVIREIDLVAEQLKRFEAEDIPVIWRPLHEANGGWFWWGDHGNESVEAYKKLWYMMFDRMMNHHKLKNLIWVWNGQSSKLAVNANTFDLAGEDIYTDPPSHASQVERFREVSSYTHGKMITLSECGSIPELDEMQRDGAMWLWWLPWWGQFVHENNQDRRPIIDDDGFPRPNPTYMEEDFLCRLFSDERVITLTDLPWYDERKHRLPTALLKNLERIKSGR
ncbi:MAG: beta-mannanase [Ruminococcaceae bacterium]|nr:beta-mannanase [Oscillospiraceae bacterium]